MESERIKEIRSWIKSDYRELYDACNEVRKNLRDNYDFIMAVTGARKGIGKTNLGIIIGILVDDKFDLEKNVAYLPVYEEIEQQFNALERYQVLDIDEAIKVLYKLRWMDRLQQLINEMYSTERKQNKCTLLLLPRFRDLNEQFRNFQVNLRIDIHARGVATFRLPERHQDIHDPWFMDENERRIRAIRRNGKNNAITIESVLKLESMLHGFTGVLTFPPLPEDIEQEYLRIHKTMREKQNLFFKETKKTKSELVAERILYTSIFPKEIEENKFSLRQMSAKYNIPWATFRHNYKKHNPTVEVLET